MINGYQETSATCHNLTPTAYIITQNRPPNTGTQKPNPQSCIKQSSSSFLIQIPTMSLLRFQLPISQFKTLNLTTPFLHGTTTIKQTTTINNNHHNRPAYLPPIRAMRSLQGRVICTTNDKTVNVEVTRLAPHPKYKRRVRKKKKFQAHDPDNQFEVGDLVQLEKCKPISKKKTFLAVPVPKRNSKKQTNEELGIPLESESATEQV